MEIKNKGGVSFLVLDTVGDTAKLNPFQINIQQIRYFREYPFDKDDPNGEMGWAVFVGKKMLVSRQSAIDVNGAKAGDTIDVGGIPFECYIASGLTGKGKGRYFFNNNNVFLTRKFVDEEGKESSGENNKFAVITVDERIIPIEPNE